MSSTTHQPLQAGERAGILDTLRGFALFGILMANAGVLSLYLFQDEKTRSLLATADLDRVLGGVKEVLIDGKFYSLFSLLFGIGFAIIFFQKNRGEAKGMRFFYRRLFFLALFGLAHSLLIWDGDILFFYAVVGAFLPLFRKLSDRTLLLLVPLLLLTPLLFDLVKVLTAGRMNISDPFFAMALREDAKAGITEQNIGSWLLTHDRYGDVLAWNRSGTWWGWRLRLDSNRVPKVLAMFLLGLVVGRSRFYLRFQEHQQLLRRIMIWGYAGGLLFGLGRLYFEADGQYLPKAAGLWDTLFYALNTVPLALAYAATFAYWSARGRKAALIRALQPVGRMALTNYIAQSAFGVLFYYGVGLGFGGRLGPSLYLPVCLAFFGFQVFYSHLWMRYFSFGPLEWLWRQLSYGRRMAIRRPVIAPSVR